MMSTLSQRVHLLGQLYLRYEPLVQVSTEGSKVTLLVQLVSLMVYIQQKHQTLCSLKCEVPFGASSPEFAVPVFT